MSFFQRHWKLVLPGAVLIAGLAWLAFGYFGVQFLFIDDRVDEAGPVFASGAVAVDDDSAVAAPVAQEPAAEAPVEPTPESQPAAEVETTTEPTAVPEPDVAAEDVPKVAELVEGTFIDRAHPTSGRAVVLTDGTEQRFLRFEDFATDNGPDLNVYLVAADATDDDGVFDDDFVDLGNLVGNIGDQNYEIPAGVDLDRYDAVVIWCVRFAVSFGAADLA